MSAARTCGTLLALFVTGCTTSAVDFDAVPLAFQTHKLGMERCDSRVGTEILTYGAYVLCRAESQGMLLDDLKFSDQALFNVHQERLLLLVQTADAQLMPVEDFLKRLAAVDTDFYGSIVSVTYATEEKRRAERQAWGAALVGAGAGLQSAAAQQRRTVNCTTVGNNTFASTTCN